MKFCKRIFIFLLTAVLFAASAFPVFASSPVLPDDSQIWIETNNEWSCTDENGKPVSGWAARQDEDDADQIDVYFLDKSGVMKTGWVKYNGNWYYLDEKTGILATDTTVDGDYAVDAEGKMIKIKNR